MRQRANLGKHRYVRQYGCTRLSLHGGCMSVTTGPAARARGGKLLRLNSDRARSSADRACAHRDLRPVLHQGSEVIVEHRLELAAPVAPEGAAIDLFSALGSGGAGRRSQRAHRRRRGAAEPLVPLSLDITPGHFLFCLIHLLQHVNG